MYFNRLRCNIGEIINKLVYDRTSEQYKISSVEARDEIYDLVRQEINEKRKDEIPNH